jgi:predicted deacylase
MKTSLPLRRFFDVYQRAYKNVFFIRALVWCAIILGAILFISTVFFSNKTSDFLFAKEQCVSGTTLLPKLQKISANVSATAEYKKTISLFNYPILSKQTCYSFKVAPKESSKIIFNHKFANISFIARQDFIAIPEYPKLISEVNLDTVSTTEPLIFTLSKPDNFFSYSLKTGLLATSCESKETKVSCAVEPLNLQHAKEYVFEIEQAYNKEVVKRSAGMEAKTANPVVIASSSIENSKIVYDKPQNLILTTDRPVIKLGEVNLISNKGKTNEKLVTTKARLEGQKIIIEWDEILARKSNFTLEIDSALASDGGSLANKYISTFTTSGGPRVKGINIRDRAVPLGQGFVISFDQTILPNQSISSLVKLKAAGADIPVNASVSGRTITLQPKKQLPFCAELSFLVSNELLSSFGIKSDVGWSFSSRTTCATTYSIGNSVKGRQVTAYRFGSGSKIIMFNGAIHGDEGNSKRILDKWIDELQGNPGKIPTGKSIVVIPLVNPDGFAAGSRFNSKGIDLNRNFPANNWKASITLQNGQVAPTGGGVTPLSEQESLNLAAAISSHSPSLVVSYHSQGGIALANDVSGAWSFAKTYASKAGYAAKTNATIGNFFDYDTTGAFEDWLADKKGIPCVLVELSTKTSDEFNANKSAMWQMVFNY